VLENATGNSGDVDVSTGSLQVSSGASLGASTRGEGNGGLLRIQVADTASFNNGDAFSQVTAGAVGNTQGIEITARALSVSNGAQLEASTFGQGDAGKITIRATDTVSFDGVSAEGFQSGAFSNVQEGGVGNTQGIEIITGTLSVTNKGQLGTNVYGTGNSGRISIFADTVTFSRGDALSQVGNLLSPQGQRAVGNSGGIEIVTGSLFLNNAASLGSSVYGQGNAGKITIRATDTVSLNGVSQADSDRSAIINTVAPGAVGNSQGIEITTASLRLNNAFLGTATFGQGDAGKIAIQAENTQVNNTVISGQIGSEAVGNSQGIDIATESLSLSNSNINTEVSGVGEAGDISIQATDVVSIENSTINSVVESLGNFTAIGKGGDITLSARALSLNNSGVFASTDGQGDAGDISVRVTDLISISGSLGFSTTVFSGGVGQGGNIDLETGDLFLGSGTRLVTATDGRGNAGKITIRARDTITLDNGVIGTSVTQNAIGNAGEIEIATDRLSLTNGALINAATNGQGNAGQVAIQATDTITLDGNSYIATSVFQNGVGNSQGITIATNQLSLTNGAFINAATFGQGNAGQVAIQATDTVTLNDGRISTSAFSNAVGNAQGINITTDRLSLANNSLLDAISAGNNEAGEITVDANRIEIDRSRIITSTLGGAGNITLRSPELVLRNNSIIRTDAFGEELIGGNITIDSDVIAALENSDINANALQGQGGNVNITAAGIFGTSVRRENTAESDITATGKDQVEDGEITLNAEIDPTSGLVSLPESPVDATSLLGKDFCSRQRNSQFIVTGRGGIPATPADVASPTTVWQDLSLMEIAEIPTTGENPEAEVPERPVLIEAQGWYRNETGQVILTANPTTAMPHPPGMIPIDCETLDKVRS
jgi:large exoprotein involved in heme utilization and adhesion